MSFVSPRPSIKLYDLKHRGDQARNPEAVSLHLARSGSHQSARFGAHGASHIILSTVMTGPKGNSGFVSPRPSMFPEAKPF